MLKKMIAAAALAVLLPATALAGEASEAPGKKHCCCMDKGKKMDCCREHKKDGHEGHDGHKGHDAHQGHEGHDMGGKEKAPKA